MLKGEELRKRHIFGQVRWSALIIVQLKDSDTKTDTDTDAYKNR